MEEWGRERAESKSPCKWTELGDSAQQIHSPDITVGQATGIHIGGYRVVELRMRNKNCQNYTISGMADA
jgi:hypothetical protein